VHHALCRVIEPLFERRFIFDSYANRVGKGTHRAMDRFRHFCRGAKYALKCDIKKFFPSIDHEILVEKIGRVIRCKRTMWLVRTIVAGSNPQEPVYERFPGDDLFTPYERRRGLPIGNLTSQFFANVYLDGLDHFIKEELRVASYVRYVDDFVLFGDDKRELRDLWDAIDGRLERDRLKLHATKTRIYRTSEGIEFLGFRIAPGLVRIKRAAARRFCTRMRRFARLYRRSETSLGHIAASVRSWLAHAAYGDTAALVGSLVPRFAFVRGTAVK
jgi:RNA-directed DNA polymerase